MVKGIIGNTLTTPIAPLKKVSQLENDAKYATADDVSSVEATAQDARRMAEWADGTANEARTIAVHNAENKADKSELPKKVSELENDAEYVTEETLTEATLIAGEAFAKAEEARQIAISADGVAIEAKNKADLVDVVSETANRAESIAVQAIEELERKVDRPDISTNSIDGGSQSFLFERRYNEEVRLARKDGISFKFGNGEYEEDYVAGLSFDSGETPTAIDYTDSGILNWVGTDCSMTYDGLSIFQPSPNTHYDIVFYFNGTQFIGLVNGFVSSIEWQGALSTGNVVSE